MTLRKLVCLLALAVPACAHQPRVREPKIDLRQLCNDVSTASFCTPAQSEQDEPLVDTNLARPVRALQAG
jgi:hypothetical protein